MRAEGGGERVVVLLGHTMDDQAETVLLGLARGSGGRSLRAMNEMTRDNDAGWLSWARPLLSVRQSETIECCTDLGLGWITDPMNDPTGPWRTADGTPLRRSAVRTTAIPALANALGMDPVPALARTARLLAVDEEALQAQTQDLWERAWTAPTLDARVVGDAPEAVRSRVIRRAALASAVPPGALTSAHIEAIDSLITHWHGQGPIDVPGGIRARRRGAVVEFSAPSNVSALGAHVDVGSR